MRTASEKQKKGHASWFGAAVQGDMSNVRRSAVVDNKVPNELRPSSPNSINFSYPRSQLEAESLGRSGSAMVYDPNSRRMVPRIDLHFEDDVRNASEKPVRRKKHDSPKSDSHLSKGTVARTKGTAVEASPKTTPPRSAPSPVVSEPPVEQRQDHVQGDNPRKWTEPEQEVESSDLESGLESEPDSKPVTEPPFSREHTLVEHEPVSDTAPTQPKRFNEHAVSPLPESPMRKKPSVVYEVPELEHDESKRGGQVSQNPTTDAIDAVPVRSSPPQPRRVEAVFGTELHGQPRSQTPTEKINGNARRRVHSESPARTTHFATVPDQLFVRHEPPPRSLSPRKSALKQLSPHRDASPSEDGSDASGAFSSMASREDSGLSRRKSVRVSFDDQNSAVGDDIPASAEVDSPEVPTSPAKKPWHSIIGRHKRDSVNLDEDEKMTPRPALPSFGSVREKKNKELEEPERPLVRPGERLWSPPATTSTPQQATDCQKPAAAFEPSSDFAISSAIIQDQSSRNEANTSKYREPLPPVVTSVDGGEYISNSSPDSDDKFSPEEVTKLPQTNSVGSGHNETTLNGSTAQRGFSEDDNTLTADGVPSISIIHPSPRVPDDQAESPQDFFDLPGGFPGDIATASDVRETAVLDTAVPSQSHGAQSQQTATKPMPAPITPQRSFDSANVGPPSPQMDDIREESEGSEGSSIYSDAYEDLSDMEGDGFLSLDAIVDSPVSPSNPIISQKLFEKAIAQTNEKATSQGSASQQASRGLLLRTPSEWENAKVYWRSLSAHERRQLEKEAMEDAGDEADLEEAPRSTKTKKQKVKKRTDKQVDLASAELTGTKAPAKELRLTEPPSIESDPSRVYQIQSGSSWPHSATESSPKTEQPKLSGPSKLRKSMRGEEPAAVDKDRPAQNATLRKSMRSSSAAESAPQNGHFRKSLGSGPETTAPAIGGMRKSLRANGSSSDMTSSSTAKKSARPVSYQPPTTNELTRNHRRNQSEERPGSSRATMKPSLRRRASDSSESSFRRARSTGGSGFRRSMRGSVQEPAPPASDNVKASSRFSLRSLSPTGSAFRRSLASSPPQVAANGPLRHSMRGNTGEGSSRTGVSVFGRSSKVKKSSSRFGDSSDEEDVRPAFSSRFRDSSDDEDTPTPKSRGNGVPKTLRNKTSSSAAAVAMRAPVSRSEDEDSEGLFDSGNETKQPRAPLASNENSKAASRNDSMPKRSGSGRETLGATQQTEVATAQAGDARLGHKRRGSFMSILRRKKDPADKISRDRKESAARRVTRLERSDEELGVIRSNSDGHPHSSRLQKRGPNWPLQEKGDPQEMNGTHAGDEIKPPSTAGGPTPKTFASSQYGPSDNTSIADHVAPEGSDAGSPKKKKFGALRKMFGLND